MKQAKTKRWVLLLAIIALFFLGGWALRQYAFTSKETPEWRGKWFLTYYYDNKPELLFSGQLEVLEEAPFQATLELFPPQSKRPEPIELTNVSEPKPGVLTGTLIHNGYKINGGFLKESFEWTLLGTDSITGVGQCLEFCAEGTNRGQISWAGRKIVEEK